MLHLVFDMDGVLCDLDDDKRIAFLLERSEKADAELRHAIWGSGFEDRSDRGEHTADAYLAEFGERVGIPLTRAEWIAYRRAGMSNDTHMLDLVRRLRDNGVGMSVLTNNGLMLKETFPQVFPALGDLFGWDHVYCSAEFGTSKPCPDVYHRIRASIMDKHPGATSFVMIDDRPENVVGAKQAGFGGIHFTGVQALVSELVLLGVDPRIFS